MFVRLVRAMLHIPAPVITPEQAISIARAEWERPGHIARPRVEERLREYVVWMYGDSVGGNVGYHIDMQTGSVLRVITLPR